jgi:hypothetical protein
MHRGLPIVLPPFVAARAVTILAMVLAIERQPGGLTWGLLRSAFMHWDSLSYLDIAAHAYPARLDYHDAFMPGYPILLRAGSLLTGDLVLAGVLVAALAEVAALLFIHELVLRERDARTARFAVWAVAFAPLGFFFTGVYTESVFIAAAAAALMLIRRGRVRGAAVAAALAVSMRLTGLVLLPVIATEMLMRRQPGREYAWLALVPAPLLLYAGYLQLQAGDALAFLHAQSLPSFGEAAAWPWDGLRSTWNTAATTTDPTNRAIFVREVVAGIGGLVVVLASWADRHFPRSFALYCTLTWLMAVSLTFWRSVPRYDLALFVAVIVAADLTVRARPVRALLIAAGAVVLAWGAYQFALGGWIG